MRSSATSSTVDGAWSAAASKIRRRCCPASWQTPETVRKICSVSSGFWPAWRVFTRSACLRMASGVRSADRRRSGWAWRAAFACSSSPAGWSSLKIRGSIRAVSSESQAMTGPRRSRPSASVEDVSKPVPAIMTFPWRQGWFQIFHIHNMLWGVGFCGGCVTGSLLID
jgi:hypothetical protein